jgi:hypothetical protein
VGVADFISERDLECVPGIVDVLDQVGDFDAGTNQRRVEMLVQLRDLGTSALVKGADHGLRRMTEVVYRCALTEKFRIADHSEIDPDR